MQAQSDLNSVSCFGRAELGVYYSIELTALDRSPIARSYSA